MIKNNRLIYFIIYFYITAIISAFGIIKINVNSFLENDIFIWSALALFLYIISVIIFIKLDKSIFSAWIIFITLAYMYWFGQSFLYLFNMLPKLSEITTYYTDSLCRALIYQTMGFGLMNLGAIFYNTKVGIKYITCFKYIEFKDNILRGSINKVASIMFIISAPVMLISLFKKVMISLTGGYLALYDGSISSISALEDMLAMFFVPSLFLLLAANKGNNIRRRIIISIFGIYIVGFLMTGGRSVAMGLGLCLMLFYHKQIKPYKGKRVIWIIIIGVILIFLIPIVGEMRGLNNRSFSDFIGIIESTIKEKNVLVSTLNSMGFSLFPMVKTMELIPNIQGFSYGIELGAAILAILPSILTFGYSFATIAALPDWLRAKLSMDYGPGYSLIAESYYNFGWLGVIMMFFSGIIIQRYFINRKKEEQRIIYDAQICILLYFLSLVIRNSFALFFRNIFFGIFIPILAINIIYINKRRKGKISDFNFNTNV